MTNREILIRAVEKAIEHGWEEKPLLASGVYSMVIDKGYPFSVNIFDHDFAKALWGESKGLTREEGDNYSPNGFYGLKTIGWQDHLRQLVIADDVFKYLEANI